jgi:hypothetical protein
MIETVLKQALVWGFVCEEDSQGNWQILPQKPTERWQVKRIRDRWLLLVGNVPQVNLHPDEVISFLERRRSHLRK